MQSTDISMPITKVTSVVTLATAAQADVADKIAQAATINANLETWYWVNSVPWGNISYIVSGLYAGLLMSEWFWKKLWRPAFERWGWIKPRKRYIIDVQEFNAMSETQRAEL